MFCTPFITRAHVARRTFLRGLGATVAVPLLDAMAPALSARGVRLRQGYGGQGGAHSRARAGFIYVPHGADMASWTPAAGSPAGALAEAAGALELSPTLQPLAPFARSLTVISNLTRAGGQAEMHAAAACGWLSGAIPKRTEGEDYRIGTTIDQVLATQIGQGSPFPSLELATEDFTGYVGGCTPGFSCAYMNTIAWASPTMPLPMEINPRVAFERLFGDGGSEAQRRRVLAEDRSVLDGILADARALAARLGPADRARLSAYLDDVREIERRIQRAEAQQRVEIAVDKPLGVPESFEEHATLMTDLLVVALQTDLTRVFTFMLSRESSQRTFPQIGVTDPWHVVSHHGEQPEKIARNAKINVLCLQLFARFLERLQATPDGDGSLLDHTVVFYGSGMGNPNVHATDPLPMVAVGGALGRGGRHVVLPARTQIGNLWLRLAHAFDIPLERFGESTGEAAFL